MECKARNSVQLVCFILISFMCPTWRAVHRVFHRRGSASCVQGVS